MNINLTRFIQWTKTNVPRATVFLTMRSGSIWIDVEINAINGVSHSSFNLEGGEIDEKILREKILLEAQELE